jgi:hypothetical protein
VINRSEVDDLISKWASEETSVRVDLQTSETNVSVTGALAAAPGGLVQIKLGDSGFIEFLLGDQWGFDYFDPDTTNVPRERRLTTDYRGNPLETGAGIVGWVRGTDHHLFILEIIEGC